MRDTMQSPAKVVSIGLAVSKYQNIKSDGFR